MKTRFSLLLAALCSLANLVPLHAQSPAFTYQGRLNQNDAPAQGIYDLRFAIHDAPTGGSPASNPITNSVVGVTNGLFTVLLDFGSGTFNGADRWLAIAVRPAGGGTFTPLNPRQPITPTPYAVTALTALTAKEVPGVSGHALHAADGSPQNAVFVDNAGSVDVGTTSPQEKLDLRSDDGSYVRVDSVNGDLKANGGSDGHWGIFNDSLVAGAGTHLIGQGVSRLFVANNGRVGIGTTTPQTTLDVRGDIRMGTSGEVRATGGAENLRIVRGVINAQGGIVRGVGFTAFRAAPGDYGITFTTPFAGPPVVTAVYDINFNDTYPRTAMVDDVTAGSANVVLRYIHPDTGSPIHIDGQFHFIAIGPR